MTMIARQRARTLGYCAAAALSLSSISVAKADDTASSTASGTGAKPAIELVHFWISPSESRALDVYRKAWAALGGVWVDTPTRDKEADLKLVSDRIANGYPPTVMQWHANEGSQELPAMGVIQDIEEVAAADHWRDFLPQNVIDRISYKGRIYFAPVDIHAENWVWTNKKIFDDLKLPPPTNWNSILDSAARIKAAGYTPIALGSGGWEISLIFNDIVYSTYGPGAYQSLMNGSDPRAALKPAMLRALGILRRLSTFVSPDRARQTWAEAAVSVGQGRAAMQFMGDYAKGELAGAGFTVDKDYRCSLAPGTDAVYFVVIDSFAFPNTNSDAERRSQLLFARQVMAKDNQLAFNHLKGSIPVRTDIESQDLDACGKIGLNLIARKGTQVSAQSMIMPSQMSQGWIDIVDDYFNDPSITPETAQSQLAEILQQK